MVFTGVRAFSALEANTFRLDNKKYIQIKRFGQDTAKNRKVIQECRLTPIAQLRECLEVASARAVLAESVRRPYRKNARDKPNHGEWPAAALGMIALQRGEPREAIGMA